jgi:hypothetical protein
MFANGGYNWAFWFVTLWAPVVAGFFALASLVLFAAAIFELDKRGPMAGAGLFCLSVCLACLLIWRR